jgi:hypothetical protein
MNDLTSPTPREPSNRVGGRLLGAVLVLAGAGCIATVFAANYGRSHAAEALAFALGLAFAPTISAIGLCLVLVGVFVFWRGRAPRP